MGDFVEPEEVAGFAQSDLDRYTCELLIRSTEAAVRRHCGWNLTEETVTDQVIPIDGCSDTIVLPTLRLTALAVTVSGTLLTVGTGYTWSSSGIVKNPAGRWSTLYGAVVGTWTHGYPAGHSALDDLKDIVGSAVARRIGNPDVLSRLRVGGIEEEYAVGPQLPSIALTRMEKAELDGAYALDTVA